MLSRLRRVIHPSLGPRAGAAARQGATTIVDQGIVSITNFLTGVIVARGWWRGEGGG
jgi:hypothetical protein